MKSIGIAQLMMQAGMFVCASSFAADIRTGIFTHCRRREDRKMRSGTFDEELQRMNSIVQQIRPHSLVLFNESFAAANEREGSGIARQIVRALLESGARILFITHLHTFASYFNAASRDTTLMMRAERASDGARSFRIVPGAPSQHSHGEDLYQKVFGGSPH